MNRGFIGHLWNPLIEPRCLLITSDVRSKSEDIRSGPRKDDRVRSREVRPPPPLVPRFRCAPAPRWPPPCPAEARCARRAGLATRGPRRRELGAEGGAQPGLRVFGWKEREDRPGIEVFVVLRDREAK